MNLGELFERFIREKTFLNNVTPKTVSFYRQSFNAYRKTVGEIMPDRFVLNDFVIKLRERGMSPTGANVYIRGINSFLSWLWENNQLGERLSIKQLKEEKKIIQTFSEAQLRVIVSYRPQTPSDKRLHAILCTLIDTGIRISEALTLKTSNVDFVELYLTVLGKGQKERIVPMSLELRRILWRYHDKSTNKSIYFFPVRTGDCMSYRNFHRDMVRLCKELKIEGVRISPHTLRHTFAKQYVRNGGNIYYLMHQLGHTSISMSKRYVEVDETDLSLIHHKVSPLGRLRH
jgi:integrase/recombinase XerD